ncbi:hypothetical protein SAMN04488168_12351 [Bacillus sp. 491mf]|uniref:hypothetical protein n=1 Tax=Bacillus sp. 491mf TaxID=1761755 RepID=UPI0008E9FE58|nr:hypothetical protein [Bacillus sp. 491mf]SFD18699.1 hypothetical protein SAMN04488168_12351 [Bacillus sp. 491mf]
MLKLNHWYEAVKKEELLKVMKKYPMFPFLIDAEGEDESSYFRWNPKRNSIEKDIKMPNIWEISELHIGLDDNCDEIEIVSYCVYPHLVINLLAQDNSCVTVHNFDFELKSHL